MTAQVDQATRCAATLTPDEVVTFEEQGFLMLRQRFSEAQVGLLRAAARREVSVEGPARVCERDGVSVRSVHGCHRRDDVFGRMVALPQLVGACRQLLRDDVYVYQFKLNNKAALVGEAWQWHQDYVYWMREDGLARPDVISAVVFVDDVVEANGPMLVVPGSHRLGVLSGPVRKERPSGYEDGPEWISNVTSELRYTVDLGLLRELTSVHGIEVPKGPAGSILLFHGNLVHASGLNLSAFDRRLAIVTYNALSNVPSRIGARPDFLCEPEPRALIMREDRELSPASRAAMVGDRLS